MIQVRYERFRATESVRLASPAYADVMQVGTSAVGKTKPSTRSRGAERVTEKQNVDRVKMLKQVMCDGADDSGSNMGGVQGDRKERREGVADLEAAEVQGDLNPTNRISNFKISSIFSKHPSGRTPPSPPSLPIRWLTSYLCVQRALVQF
jgi:hypothetical protein